MSIARWLGDYVPANCTAIVQTWNNLSGVAVAQFQEMATQAVTSLNTNTTLFRQTFTTADTHSLSPGNQTAMAQAFARIGTAVNGINALTVPAQMTACNAVNKSPIDTSFLPALKNFCHDNYLTAQNATTAAVNILEGIKNMIPGGHPLQELLEHYCNIPAFADAYAQVAGLRPAPTFAPTFPYTGQPPTPLYTDTYAPYSNETVTDTDPVAIGFYAAALTAAFAALVGVLYGEQIHSKLTGFLWPSAAQTQAQEPTENRNTNQSPPLA